MSDSNELVGLSFTSCFPLSWSLLPDKGEEAVGYSQALEQINFNRLQVILGLDESSRELYEDESGVFAEIERLDFKINVLLELVAQLVSKGNKLPEPVSVTLSPQFLVWEAHQNPPPKGSKVAVDIFPDLRFPFPLVLQGRVDSVAGSMPYSVRVVLAPCSEPLQEMLEKFIFRCHRRQIARLKKSGV